MAPAEEIALRTTDERHARLKRLLPLLACPACGGGLLWEGDELISQGCGLRYPVLGGVPVLLPAQMVQQGLGRELGLDDNVSMHPYSTTSQDIIDSNQAGWVLDLGAGGKHIEHANVVQVDVFRFPMTDVVGSADSLPFKAGVFDAVVSQAVFEHLQYPEAAASEVWRVLRVDGVAKVDTAFLQPEHAYPHHYFNATEAGLKHWFRDFDIEWSGVEAYQTPKWSLVWFLSVYLASLPDEHREVLEPVGLGRCVEVLSRLSKGNLLPEDLPVVTALDALAPESVRKLAAGVSVRARKLPGLEAVNRSTGASGQGDRQLVMALERRLEQLTNEKLQGVHHAESVRQMGVLAADRSRFLLQARGPMGRLPLLLAVFRLFAREAKHRLPVRVWAAMRRVYRSVFQSSRSDAAAPATRRAGSYVSFWAMPKRPVELIDLFFSMVHQTHGGWELCVVVDADANEGMARLAAELGALDDRVRVLDALQRPGGERNGMRWVQMANDSVLATNAVFELITLSGQVSDEHVIACDVDHWYAEQRPPMHCVGWWPDMAVPAALSAVYSPSRGAGEAVTLLAFPPSADPSDWSRAHPVAYIPKVLFRVQPFADV